MTFENFKDASMSAKYNIKRLKKGKNAIILAHYYQDAAIHDGANFIGDSLALSYEAAKINASVIVFAGVVFMAETAIIMSLKKVPAKQLAGRR